jgi:thiol-disulfide isomerase/thioredoxin
MVLLIMPLVGVVGTALLLIGGSERNSTGQGRSGDRATPRPATFAPPTPAETLPPSILDQPAPSITLSRLDGSTFTLQDYQGRPVVLNFWASWCTPCIEEMPALQAFSHTQGPDGALVLAVTDPDNAQTRMDVEDFLKKYNLTLPVGLDQQMALHYAMGVAGLPMTFFIDAAGIVRGRRIGAVTLKDLEDEVALLAKPGS